jgi:S-adenosylmethionine synthetase
MTNEYLFTSEAVTPGHPDKLCDQISDAVVDHFLQRDPCSRVVAECAVANGIVFMSCRFSSTARVDLAEVAREVIADAGYDDSMPFNASECTILTTLQETPLSPLERFEDLEVNDSWLNELVALNQVNVFGYACDQTPALMPMPIWLAQKLARRLAVIRARTPFLRPDGHVQVGVEYRDRRPHRLHNVTLLASHVEKAAPLLAELRELLHQHVLEPVFAKQDFKPDAMTQFRVNPYGPIGEGGPRLHSGLTGRKNGIDTYGEYARHSGAALSGKDPLRIDRIGAYAARHAAKNLVAAGLAQQCEVHLGYAIGKAQPVSVRVNSEGTGIVDDESLRERLLQVFDFRLGAIVRAFRLRQLPAERCGRFYRELAALGHMGREELNLPWERTDQADRLK